MAAMRSSEALNPSSSRYHSGGYSTPTVIVSSLISWSPHQVLGAVAGLDGSDEHEAVLLEYADRRGVLRIGTRRHCGIRAEPEHHVAYERADRLGADAASDERRVTEEVVHARG